MPSRRRSPSAPGRTSTCQELGSWVWIPASARAETWWRHRAVAIDFGAARAGVDESRRAVAGRQGRRHRPPQPGCRAGNRGPHRGGFPDPTRRAGAAASRQLLPIAVFSICGSGAGANSSSAITKPLRRAKSTIAAAIFPALLISGRSNGCRRPLSRASTKPMISSPMTNGTSNSLELPADLTYSARGPSSLRWL